MAIIPAPPVCADLDITLTVGASSSRLGTLTVDLTDPIGPQLADALRQAADVLDAEPKE
ncbi:hypothetical protein [Allonocardiopsis opalescens]|uniref:Uncharacterized protein n=1 Tax=Allonocardiopsis opalescens TaxID=1144618 RepID=A0A2T0PQ30_9ACTN|nr:hypothetical protein [Allonocardiopsis opalescens]PRX90826.1 hypothetical protein CLV72_11622 [Allonocardiopsis opalescens]